MHADSLLEPDDVTFSVLVRGYGETEPPQWLAISGLLSMMSKKYEVQPSTGNAWIHSVPLQKAPLIHVSRC